MKIKTINKIFCFFLIFCFISAFSLFIPIVSSFTGQLHIEDWDDYFVHATSGSNTIGSWQCQGPWEIKTGSLHSLPNVLGEVVPFSAIYKTFYNFSSIYYDVGNISIYIKGTDGTTSGTSFHIQYYDNIGLILYVSFSLRADTGAEYFNIYTPTINNAYTLPGSPGTFSYRLDILPATLNYVTYRLWNFVGTTKIYDSGLSYTGYRTDCFKNLSRIEFNGAAASASTGTFYIDDINMTGFTQSGGISNSINIKFYDQMTNERLYLLGDNPIELEPYWDNMLLGDIYAPDLWNGDYLASHFQYWAEDDYIHFDTNTFTEGDRVAIYTENMHTREGIYYQARTTWITLYNNKTYDIYLWQMNYFGFENIKEITFKGLNIGIATDKAQYQYPEQVLMAYKLPTLQEWLNVGGDLDLWIRCVTEVPIWVSHWSEPSYNYDEPLTFSNDWVYLPAWNCSKPTDNLDNYEMALGTTNWFWFIPTDFTFISGLYFDYVNYGGFHAHGNITNINPSEPLMGETVTITFNANNYGKLSLYHADTGIDIDSIGFDKPQNPLSFIAFNPTLLGTYIAKLYVNDGEGLQLVDQQIFFVNLTGTGYGEFGTGEFLECITPRVVKGENVTVIYRSFKNDSLLTVRNGRNAQTMYSMIVKNTSGWFHFKVPSYATIGKWNLTLNATDLLKDYFYVIADDNNYIEAIAKSYRIDETPMFNLKHDKRIKIKWIYEGIAYGPQIWLESNNFTFGVLPMPDTSILKEGLWTVELWETNDRTPRNLLAMDEFMVTPPLPININPDNSLTVLVTGPFAYLLGTFITIACCVLPVFIIRGLHIENDVFKYIPLFTGITGVCLSILLGLFPVWVVAVIITILAIFIAVMWLQRKQL